ncbi:DUF533 domain-containing protein [Aliiroseovarius sp. KMU-50]|uniref:DUF533 domain-containing protein n=1 Tax=Aliiroseovarius salicola TaxID=3009082 RepID=A0ABT4W3T6_9RHOB|nr:DUF533 domain-containing protein [Aliiroseovarius sp. KMU-50]MDA5095151.1 DUF533 domain-containing protein [Aliiroseovarius sp. KMU-50]
MRYLIFTLAALASILVADAAEARRGGGSTSQTMLFVAETPIELDGQPYALCHLVDDSKVLFIPLFRSVEGYVLAANRCAAEEYYELPTERFVEGKADGAFPADLPDTPKLSTSAMINGHWGWVIVLGFIGFAVVAWLKTRKRRTERQALMGDLSPVAKAILDAMCHAAKADGNIDETEVVQIARIAQEMTGETFDLTTVRRMSELAEEKPADNYFKSLAKGLNPNEASLMMKAVLMVVAADGTLGGKEQGFVGRLAKVLKLGGEQVNALLNQVVATPGVPESEPRGA